MSSLRTRARQDGWDHGDCDLEFALSWASCRHKDPDLVEAFKKGWHERQSELEAAAHHEQQQMEQDQELVERLWPLIEAKLAAKEN